MRKLRAFAIRAALLIAGMGVLASLIAPSASAQTFRGTILGTVTDTSGAAILNAKVTIHNIDTGVDRSTESNTDGSYLVPELPVGTYTVTVELNGFQKSVTTGVRVDVATERRVDVTLKPGQISQQIVVEGETLPQLDATSDTLGGTIDSRQIEDLPINGRDYTKLLIMVPGAVGEPNGGGDSPGSYGLFSANGSRGRSNNYLLDGTDMNDGYRNLPAINQGGVFGVPGTILPEDSISELSVQSNFQAEYGRNSGAVVNIVTKSGGNNFHGTAFEDFRNAVLNARNFFNTSDQPKDAFRNNQFGGALGGPIVRDKAFFYLSYEGQREGMAITSLNTVPTLNDGVLDDPNDYAQVVQSIGGNPSLCTTTVIACIDGQAPGVINPVIKNLYDLCNSNGHCSGGQNVWPLTTQIGGPASNNLDSVIAKIDYNWNQRNQISGRYFFGNSNQSFPLGVGGGNNLPNTNTNAPIRTQLISISWIKNVSPDKTNEARFGWNRYRNGFFPQDASIFGNPNDTLEMNTGITNPRDFGLPTIKVGGAPALASLGSSAFANPRNRVDSNWQAFDNFTWTLNRHALKFGAEFRRTTVDSFNDLNERGTLKFSDLSDFLTGTLSGGTLVAGNTSRNTSQNSAALYVQDSYRVTSQVTVNVGLRWDYFGVIGDNKQFSIYDPNVGLVLKSQLYPKDYNNFSPRASVAWDVFGKSKTVLRAGFGVFYDGFSQDFFTGQLAENTFNTGPAYNAIGPNPIFITTALNTGILEPGVPIFTGVAPGEGNSTTDAFSVARDLRTPYIYNYNLNVQQELLRNTVLQVGYVGSAGRKLFRFRDINQPTEATIQAYDYALNGCCVPRPFDDAAPLSPLAPNAPFYVNQLETEATSNYNSLQVSLSQRNWHGLNTQIAYTWSHSIDTASDGQDFVPNASQPNDSTNPQGNKGPSNFDTRNRFVWSTTYDLPKWEVLGRMGEGWALSGVLTLMSGHPFSLNYAFEDDYDGSGEFFGRPDFVAPAIYNRSNPSQFLDLSSFAVPCTLDGGGTSAQNCVFAGGVNSMHFGSLGRNALLGPDYRNFDFAITKMTSITERIKLQFRTDFYNLTNHPNFANPLLPAFFADAAFNGIGVDGRSLGFFPITATSDVGLGNPVLGGGGQRSIQFGLKLIF